SLWQFAEAFGVVHRLPCVLTSWFSVLFQIIAFDELRTDFKSPIDQCNPVHAVSCRFC
uniref:Uncharacterized protein n=1 Tax=Marmota marmota marmota TaxID=9994 RepID=A0A8C6EQR0_MARMA